MDDNKEEKFTFRRALRRNFVIGGVVVSVLLLSSLVSLAVCFSLSKQKPARLVEIDLKEGETLTYRVDQHIELHGREGQKGESLLFFFFTAREQDLTLTNLYENKDNYV